MAMISVIALTLAATIFIVRSEEARHQEELRSHTIHQLSSIRAKAEGIINSTLFLTRGVVAYIASHPETNQAEFHQLAKDLLLHDTHIRNMGLARNNVITHMYPIEGNEAAIGLRYMDHPKQRGAVLRAMETKKTVVAGPVNLVQGGKAFISRTPVFLTPSGSEPGSGDYWGIVSMVIDMDTLFKVAEITSTTDEGLRVAIRGKDGLGAEGTLFFGDEIVFQSDPILLDVTLPEGSWQIAAIPSGGWNSVSDRAAFFKFSGILISIMLAISIWLFGRLSKEVALRKSEETSAEADRKVKELADSLSQVVYRADAKTFQTLYINNAVEKIFGYSVEEWIKDFTLWEESIHSEDKDEVFKILEDAKGKGEDLYYEYRIIKKDGNVRWVEDRITWERDDEGNIDSVSGLIYDITERKTAAAKLLQTQEDIQAIFNNIQDAFYRTDINGYITMLSPSASELMKCDKEKLMGQKLADFYEDPKGRADFLKSLTEAGGRLKNYEARIKAMDGSIIWVSTNAHFLYDESNNVTGVEGTVRDITLSKLTEEKLILLKKAIDTTQVGITLADMEGNIIYSNPAEATLHGYPTGELTGKNVSLFTPEGKGQKLNMEAIMKAETKRRESINLRKDGSSFPVYLTSNIVTNPSDDPIGLVTICEDITDRKRTEETLRKYTQIVSTSKEHLSFLDSNYVYQAVNDAYLKATDKKRVDIVGHSVPDLLGEEIFVKLVKENLDLALSGKEINYEAWFDFIGLGRRYMDVYYYPCHDANGTVSGVVVNSRDITNRKKTAEQLARYSEQLRNLTNSLQSAREEERKKIAREIHDELGQSLTALKIDLSLMKKKLPEDETALHKRADTMIDIINLTLQSVKRIAKELRPEILEELGLEAATKLYIKEFSGRALIKCVFKIVGPCDNLSKDISLVLFRIIQEATTNIVRHAEAKRARIYLECKEKGLLLKISDDGKGINETDIYDPMSIGLIGMNERIHSVGGHFAIRGIGGVGTTVKVYIPEKATRK